MEYASRGVGNAALTTGIIGTAGTALATGLLGNLGLGNNNQYVTKEVIDLMDQLQKKNTENAILSADLSSEKKMVEVFNAANDKINAVYERVSDRILDLERKVDSNAASQAVINSQYNANLTLVNSQIAQLYSLTKLGIPNSSLCPGYGAVTVTPTGCGTVAGTSIA